MRPGVLIAVVVIGAVFVPLVLRGWAALRYRSLTYTVETVPARRVAIVFGAQIYPDGSPSPMLADRVATGADLWRAGKADVLLLTGDNRFANYNEPEVMRRYALSLGVPDEALVLDYAGRRTYDSCYRARDIFGVRDPIVVTQNFHLDRTLFTCRALGLEAVGVAADYQRPSGYDRRSLWYGRLRELPALTIALLEVSLLRPRPVLGDPLPIFPEGERASRGVTPRSP
jgi:SanA protein